MKPLHAVPLCSPTLLGRTLAKPLHNRHPPDHLFFRASPRVHLRDAAFSSAPVFNDMAFHNEPNQLSSAPYFQPSYLILLPSCPCMLYGPSKRPANAVTRATPRVSLSSH